MPPLSRAVSVNDPSRSIDNVLEKLAKTDLIITDLDDTDLFSPAKRIAYSYLLRPDMALSSRFLRWAVPCLIDLLIHGQQVEEAQWKRFEQAFLRDPVELQRQLAWHEEHAAQLSYPGLMEFYGLFPNAKKAYVSRNIQPLLEVYAKAYGFDLAIGEAYPPWDSLDRIFTAFPTNRNVLFKGDSSTDEQTLAHLRGYLADGRIDTLTSIHTQGPFSKDRPTFDLSIPRDYRPLVALMGGPLPMAGKPAATSPLL